MALPEDFQYTREFEIGSFQVRPDGAIRLNSLADLLQEIAWRHADSGDFGRNLLESQQMWVLSRLEIQVFDFPKWGDQVQIFTGGRGSEKLFAFREFMVWDAQKRVLVRAMSSWLLLNAQSKRILRPESVLPPALFDPAKKPAWQPSKIAVHGELIATEEIRVRYADLDLYDHVNNTAYIRWVENMLADQGIFPNRFSINYQAECLAGETVLLNLFGFQDEHFVEGRVGEKVVFSATAYSG